MSGTLIASISGIRGIFGDGLDPAVLVKFVGAYGSWCVESSGDSRPTVVVGRDARVTGPLCSSIVCSTLQALGCDVIDAGLSTTPTVEMAVMKEGAAGGIILSASHNPEEWNALKLLNGKGEFLSPDEGRDVLARVDDSPVYVRYDRIGSIRSQDFLDYHIYEILGLDFIDSSAIANQNFHVLVDGVNSVGGIALPALLEKLGVDKITRVNCEPTGLFAHPAEPLPQNLLATTELVRESGADVGLVVDPDADRLALIANGGTYVSEELTQVIAADFLWRIRSGPFATNLSSSRAIELVAQKHDQEVFRSAVGEINVVKKMQSVGAVLGGEGNGGVILPDLHYGRDALVGSAMVLQHLANLGTSLADLVSTLPTLSMAKKKIEIGSKNPDEILAKIAAKYASEKISTIDGVKIDFAEGWVHVRKSNTEPIVRVYSEAGSGAEASDLADRFLAEVESV